MLIGTKMSKGNYYMMYSIVISHSIDPSIFKENQMYFIGTY